MHQPAPRHDGAETGDRLVDPLAGLVARAGHDEQAAGALVQALQGDVRRLCRSLVDEQSADDLAQESLVKVLRAAPGWRGEASVRVWALAIARRTAMDHLRAVTRRRRLDALLLRERPATSRPLAAAVEADELLAGLPVDLRAAFVLTQLVGLEYAEAATVLGCPVGTVRSRVHRARARLVDALEDSSADGSGGA